MPESINSAAAMLDWIAIGILVGFGWALVQLAVQWPAGKVSGGAVLICVLLALAWLV